MDTQDTTKADIVADVVTGAWTKLEGALSTIDAERAKSCNDDMDTLLTFSGLYSAVLTAFLIESYRALQQDPETTSVQLLRQISAHTAGYTQSNGFSNATTTGPPISPFRTGLVDIRVNVCWFASLLFSLISASFGFLVKQWLHEYFDIVNIVPKQRMRIRYFRYTGLKTWQLFEIAAILPLMIQIALALFFVGLCYFTWIVHPAIGITSIVLVSGWAVFFAFATIAPLWFPRCPYKTTLLDDIFHGLRSKFRAVAPSIAKKHADDENSLCELECRDLRIFDDMDQILLDNVLLAYMSSIIRRETHPAENVYRFAVDALNRRLDSASTEWDDNCLCDLRSLSESSWNALAELIGHAMQKELESMHSREVVNRSKWFYKAFRLLTFSVTPGPLPENVVVIMSKIMCEPSMPVERFLPTQAKYPTRPVGDFDMITTALSNLSQSLRRVDPAQALSAVKDIISRHSEEMGALRSSKSRAPSLNSLDDDGETQPRLRSSDIALEALLDKQPRSPLSTLAVKLLVELFIHFFVGWPQGEQSSLTRRDGAWKPWMNECLLFILKAIRVSKTNFRTGSPFDKEFQRLMDSLFRPNMIPHFLQCLMLGEQSRTLTTRAGKRLLDLSVIDLSDDDDDDEDRWILEAIHACEAYLTDAVSARNPMQFSTAVRLTCWLMTLQPRDSKDSKVTIASGPKVTIASGLRSLLAKITSAEFPDWKQGLTDDDREAVYQTFCNIEKRDQYLCWRNRPAEKRLELLRRRSSPEQIQEEMFDWYLTAYGTSLDTGCYDNGILQFLLASLDTFKHPDALRFLCIRRITYFDNYVDQMDDGGAGAPMSRSQSPSPRGSVLIPPQAAGGAFVPSAASAVYGTQGQPPRRKSTGVVSHRQSSLAMQTVMAGDGHVVSAAPLPNNTQPPVPSRRDTDRDSVQATTVVQQARSVEEGYNRDITSSPTPTIHNDGSR